jgi:2-iminobutanoate/2-iminopropanoate deaminase
MLRSINPPGLTAPGVSQAVLVEGGRPLYLSGHVPFDSSGQICGFDHASQLDQVFRNIATTLKSAGVGFEAMARLTIYVRDYKPALLETIRSVRNRWIGREHPTASVLIGVASLFHPDVLVEADAIAVVPG